MTKELEKQRRLEKARAKKVEWESRYICRTIAKRKSSENSGITLRNGCKYKVRGPELILVNAGTHRAR